MIRTAVDTSVLLDVLLADPEFGAGSLDALRRCSREGPLLACEVVWAEVTAAFGHALEARRALDDLEVAFHATPLDAALLAGVSHHAWRAAGGRRERVVPDFLIGAHASCHADRLLTRDRGFHRRWFARLVVVDPSS